MPSDTIIRKRWTPPSGQVKVWTEKADGDEQYYIRVPVSSTSEDRDGDNFSRQGIEDLRAQFESGTVSLFPDHGASEDKHARYPWKDIMGRWEAAEIEDETVYATARLNRENEDADVLRRYLEEDMAVGFSVGFRAVDYDGDMQEGYTFHDTDLVETSSVGIPSNPDGVAAMSAEDSGWRKDLDDADDSQTPAATPDDTMTDSDTDTYRERMLELFEAQQETLEKQDETLRTLTDRIDDLATRADDSDDEDEDDEDDDKEDGEDDSDSDDDEEDDSKSVTIVAGDDASEDVTKRLEELRELANDDGELDLEESKTTLFGEADEDDEQDTKNTTDDEDDPLLRGGF